MNKLNKALDTFIKNRKWADGFECLKTIWNESKDYRAVERFRDGIRKNKITSKSIEIYKATYDLTARDVFDDFMLALEWDRPPEQQFWLPRREKLMVICNALQDLEDDKLDELLLSQPPRTGKTSIVMFFSAWVMLRRPEEANLYTSYSDTVTNVFYKGLLELFNDPFTYRWKEIFPERSIARTNAADQLLDIDREKRYASFTARSLYGTLNGACDCSPHGIAIADDLHSGIEEAMNRQRLDSAWAKVENNFLSRAKPTTKHLWIGTRWSLYDCISRRVELLETDPKFKKRRFKIVNVPALNEHEQSNFEYLYGVGFDTDYYLQRKASFERSGDLASFLAQYQGTPVERIGTVFDKNDMRYFTDIGDEEPDQMLMVIDPAWGGGDYVAGVVVAKYDTDLYILDVIFDNSDKKVTQPRIAQKAMKWGVTYMYIEATRTTSSYAEGVDELLRKQNYRVRMNTSTKHWSSQGGKTQRILDHAPDIRENCLFKTNPEKEYSKFMDNVFEFSFDKKVKHDDAPDVLAMLITAVFNGDARAIIRKRPI